MTESEKSRIVSLWESGMTLGQIRQMVAVDRREFADTIREMKRNGEFPTTRKTASEIERGSEAHRVDSLKTLKDKDRSAISQTKTTEVPAGYDETDPF